MSPSEATSLAGSNRTPFALPTGEQLRSMVVGPVRAVAFWTAIALPLLSLPMVLTGVVWKHPLALLSLFALNVVAFVLGHRHNQPDAPQDD
jgi:hypothetical protein